MERKQSESVIASQVNANTETRLRKELIRPCERYYDEYEQCKTFKSRRQQLFVHGQYFDCEPWNQDHENCAKWMWHGDEEAARAIIEHEKGRLDERFVPHFRNEVWSKREKPPEDWNKPLPEFERITENTYLDSIKKYGEDSVKISSYCVIQ